MEQLKRLLSKVTLFACLIVTALVAAILMQGSWPLVVALGILVAGHVAQNYFIMRYKTPIEKGLLTRLSEIESTVNTIKLKTGVGTRDRNVRF